VHKPTDSIARQSFTALNAVLRPAVQAGVGNPLPIGAGAVVLETIGRVSGLTRQVPLLAARIGNTLTVSTVRSDSQWMRNAEADPNVAVWLGGQRREATATVQRGALNTVRLELVS
jgi:hypothetical protein